MVSLQIAAPQASHTPGASPATPPAPASRTAAPPAQHRSFYAALPGTLVYPLKGSGLWIIVGWILLSAVRAYMAYLPSFGLLILFAKMLLTLMVVGYLCAYELKLIVSSAAGEEVPPDWPDLSDLWSGVLRPILLVTATGVVGFLPAWIYLFANFNMHGWHWGFVGSPHILLLLVVLGAIYSPMALLSVAMQDSLRGLNPLTVCVSIGRVFVPYLLTCGILVLLVLGSSVFNALPRIPVVSFVVSAAVFIYLLMVEMRLVGLLYYSYRFRLNWFDEATERPRPRWRDLA